MIILSSYQELSAAVSAARPRVVVIGNFDGVHRGHQELFRRARARAAELSGVAVALTFEPHPARVLRRPQPPLLITPRVRKRELIAACQLDVLCEQTFDLDFAAYSPERFVEQVLLEGLGASQILVGYDFSFGKGRAGNTSALRELASRRGVFVDVVPAFSIPDPQAPAGPPILCASSLVRSEVQAGRLARAALILGRDVEFEGEAVRGAGRGSQIGIPTANLRPGTELLPPPGIYAAWAEILEPAGAAAADTTQHTFSTRAMDRAVRARHPAAVSVGYNPTFARSHQEDPLTPPSPLSPLSIEAHLITPHGAPPLGPLYGAWLRLQWRAHLRAEQRFESVAALVEQIHEDIVQTCALLEVTR